MGYPRKNPDKRGWGYILFEKKKRNFIIPQATKFCSIRIIGFRYSYFTVRITINDLLVPSFKWKGNECLYRGNDQYLG